MSEHDDTQLDDFMDGKSSLNSTYRAGRQEEPSATLDAHILALASKAVSKSDNKLATGISGPRKRPKWLLPLSVAATVMLGVNLAYNLKDFSSNPEFESNGSDVMSDVGKKSASGSETGTDTTSMERYKVQKTDSARLKQDEKLKRKGLRDLQAPKMENVGNETRAQHPKDADTGTTLAFPALPRPESEGAAYNHKQADELIAAQSSASQPEPASPREDLTTDDQVESRIIGLIDTRIRQAELDSAAPQAMATGERTNSQIAEVNREAKNRKEEPVVDEETAQMIAESTDSDNGPASFSPPPSIAPDTAPAPVAARTIRDGVVSGAIDDPCRRRPRSNELIEQIIHTKTSTSPQRADEWLLEISALASDGQVASACLQLGAFEHVHGKNAVPLDFPVRLTD